MSADHAQYMEKCLQLARKARSNGKTGVGAIVIRDGQIVGEGVEGDNALPLQLAHAEILAITQASSILATRDLSDCSLYTTVEPCMMCSYLIRSTRIKEVIFGVDAGSVGGATSRYPILTADDIDKWGKPPVVISGVMDRACRDAL